MRELVATHRPDLLELAVSELGHDPFERLSDGTAALQPAIFCASVASLRLLGGEEPQLYAGHSLGELSALVAAGGIAEADGLRLVVERGRLMQRAADEGPPGSMLAVGADVRFASEVARSFGLTVANDNSPEQVVLSGPSEAVLAARAEVKGRGLRAFRLPIKGAFHSPALAGAAAEFRRALDEVDVSAPRRPVLSGVTATDFDDVRARLAEALTAPVRWRELVLALSARGATRFVEAAPGNALTGLVRATLGDVDAAPADELEAVRA